MLISNRYQFIFVRDYKVAGSSVESFLAQFCMNPTEQSSYLFPDTLIPVMTKYGVIASRGIYQHARIKEVKDNILDEELFQNYTKCCIIRNPYDRLVSLYHWITSKSYMFNYVYITSFSHFCKVLIETMPIHDSHVLYNDKPICDFHIRYEHLKEDIIELLSKVGITEYDIDKLPNHKSEYRPKNKHYREYYDEETRELVYQYYKKEFDAFSYTF